MMDCNLRIHITIVGRCHGNGYAMMAHTYAKCGCYGGVG